MYARTSFLPASAALAALVAAVGCAGNAIPATHQPAAPRIVAMGDVHGDLEATRALLRLAGAIDAEDRWVGGDLVVVQTGDQLDRGDEERAILDLFTRLTDEAARAGGAFHALNGNHELMNVLFDFRYVTEAGLRDFEGAAVISEDDPLLEYFPPEEHARAAAFRPGGPYARVFARRNTILMVGDNVFVHGGVLPEHAEYGIERINAELRAWLAGLEPPPVWSEGADSPVWTRLYSSEPGPEACATLEHTLALLDARRMIVAHTPHRDGITPYCGEQVWVIDVGIASYYGGRREILEIRGDTVRTLAPPN